MKQAILVLFIFLCSINGKTIAQSRDAVKTSTDVLMFATPVAGFIATLALEDYKGTKQLVLSGATSLAATYILKHAISKRRPDGSDFHSFPSNHTAVSFQGASFVQRRYGWKYGIPAYLVSGYVAWGRVYAKRHDTWDVIAGAIVGIGSTYIFTRPFTRKHNLSVAPVLFDHERWGVCVSMNL